MRPSAASARASSISSAASSRRRSTNTWQRDEQRAVELEGRVLGGRADQHDRAVLDIGQEAVLLGAVEAVDLVDEQQRAAGRRRGACAPPRRSCADRRRRRTPPRAARTASTVASASSRAIVVLPQPGGPQRIIEASRRCATMRPIGPSGPQQMVLADHLGERLRPQPVGQRAGRLFSNRLIAPSR